jgi:phospholipid/cholesterol/gamma-HCH transport system substrate-binding protein
MTPGASAKLGRRAVGVLFLVVLALLAWLAVAVYQKKFTPVAMVTLYTTSAGNEMNLGAEVMVRGVQIGEVRQITANGSGARLELAIDPGMVGELPANTSAEMLPTTLFGERYVDLILPAKPSAQMLANGSVIAQDRSGDALELETVLNNLLPMLSSFEPDKLSLILNALGQSLQGRGAELGQTLTTLNSYLGQLNPQLPAVDTDIKELAGLARTYNKAAPGILSALNDFTATSQVVASERANVVALLDNLTTAATDLRSFLAANQQNIIALSGDSTSTLNILARYSPEFPCTLQDLAAFVPAMNKVLGQGTDEPGLHVNVTVVEPIGHDLPSNGRYLPGEDTPVYGDNTGPHCYPVPFSGVTLHDGTSSTSKSSTATSGTATSGTATSGTATSGTATSGTAASGSGTQASASAAITGPGGAPQDSELIRELAGLALGRPPAAVPGWASLLVGPLYRGTTVILR